MLSKLSAFYKELKLKGKIALVFLIGISVYLLVFTIFILVFYRTSLRKEYIQSRERAVGELAGNLDTQIDLINTVSISIIGDNTVRSFLKEPKKTVAMEQQVQSELYQNAFISDYIESIYLIDLAGHTCLINYSDIDATRKSSFSSEWKEELEKEKGRALILMNAGGAYSNYSYDVLSLMRAVFDIDSQKLIGYLVINMPVAIFMEPFENFWEDTDIYICGEDRQGSLIVEKGDAGILEKMNFSEKEDSCMVANKGMESCLFLEEHIADGRLALIYVSRIGFWKSFSLNFLLFVIVFIVITIILLLVLNRTITHIVTEPIAKLVNSMERVKEGRLYRVSMQTNNDEIGMLKDTYNTMLIRMNQLIKDLVNEERAKKFLELDVLHEQIKPHFLYNSLSSIEYLALTGNLKETVTGIETLERFYRNFLSSGLKNVAVEQEVMITRDYLTLQKMRFGDLFDAEFEVEDGLKEVSILKLILQPLVENSLMHGIYPKGEHGTIRISISRDAEEMLVSVYDDGVGMEKDTVTKVMEEKKESKNFGLKGTIMRIQYHYGIEDFYEISSELGCYTKIQLRIPIRMEE